MSELNLYPDLFWNLSPYEFELMVYGYFERARVRRNDILAGSWYVEAFARTKILPKLENLMVKKETMNEEPKKQTDEEMLSICKMLNTALGGDEVIV